MTDNHDQIRRDNENARQGTKPFIHNEINMRLPTPPEEKLSDLIRTDKDQSK
jgi:hypothetical protein